MPTPTTDSTRTTKDLANQLRDGVREEADRVSDLAKDAVEGGKIIYDAGHERLSQEIEYLRERISKLADQAMRQGETSVHAVTDAVANRPLLSICGAFAAGVIVSLILGGRRSS